MRARVETGLVAVLATLLVVTIVIAVLRRGDDAPVLPPEVVRTPTPTLAYDGTLEPAAAVLTLVPQRAATLTVTDLDRIRNQLGDSSLTGADPAPVRDAFWSTAQARTALLTGGLLRPEDAQLSAGYGFTEDDVSWEAHFFDAHGTEIGWVLDFRADLDMSLVQHAVDAGVGPLKEGEVDSANHLVTHGTTPFPDASWAAVKGTSDLVGLPANSTYLQRGCLPGSTEGSELDPLHAYSMAFGANLATARLGEPRLDLFQRLRLDPQVPGFAAGFENGVADPTTGRLGYLMVDPPTAADLALSGRLPFAACSQTVDPAAS